MPTRRLFDIAPTPAEVFVQSAIDNNLNIMQGSILALNPDEKIYSINQALIKASGAGSCQVLPFLLERGADLRYQDGAGKTALHHASDNKQPNARDMVQNLLQAGADVNSRQSDGATPLHYAAKNASCDVMAILLEAGAQIDAKTTEDGDTPLSWATRMMLLNSNRNNQQSEKLLEACKFLLERGADANDLKRFSYVDDHNRWLKDLSEWYMEKLIGGHGIASSNNAIINSMQWGELRVANHRAAEETTTGPSSFQYHLENTRDELYSRISTALCSTHSNIKLSGVISRNIKAFCDDKDWRALLVVTPQDVLVTR